VKNDLKAFMKEERIEKAVTAEERMRFKVLQETYHFLKKYLEHISEVFDKARIAIEELKRDIEEVESLSEKLSDPFVKVEKELSIVERETEKLLESLGENIKKHKNALSLLRNRILYEIKYICSTLMGMEKHLKEEERRKEVARAS